MQEFMQELIHKVSKTITDHALLASDTPAVLMVSGGSDSTALAYLFAELARLGRSGETAILHVNHMLRGEDAYADQAFVAKLAQSLKFPFFCCEIDVALLAKEGGNIEAIGREERYLAAREALSSVCLHVGKPISEGVIVTAHTQDDRVENFYMRSIVGTGPGGFRSMRYKNNAVVRPLLDCSRQELRTLLEELDDTGVAIRSDAETLWQEDATNAHTDRLRAYVRHEIVPLAQARNPHLLDTLCRTMNQIADEDDYLEQVAQDTLSETLQWIIEENTDDGIKESAYPYQEDPGEIVALQLLPVFGAVNRAVQRRCVHAILVELLGSDARIEASSVTAVLDAFDAAGAVKSGYVANIAGDLAVSANKRGVRIEPMARFRARRKPDKQMYKEQ